MSKRTIGFFGDSFCGYRNVRLKNTYIDMVASALNLQVVHLGSPGSSIEDVILNQFSQFNELKVPDICVFIWTDIHRLYNKNCRNINGNTIKESQDNSDPEYEIMTAAKSYYTTLYDYDWHLLRHNAMIYYFNNFLLEKYKNIKVINLWSLTEIKHHFKDNKKDWQPENAVYPFRLSRGVEIRPSLMSLSLKDTGCPDNLGQDTRSNHLGDQNVNKLLADYLIDAIDNYESGKLITMDFNKL